MDGQQSLLSFCGKKMGDDDKEKPSEAGVRRAKYKKYNSTKKREFLSGWTKKFPWVEQTDMSREKVQIR